MAISTLFPILSPIFIVIAIPAVIKELLLTIAYINFKRKIKYFVDGKMKNLISCVDS